MHLYVVQANQMTWPGYSVPFLGGQIIKINICLACQVWQDCLFDKPIQHFP